MTKKSSENKSSKNSDWAIEISGIPAVICMLLILSSIGYTMYTRNVEEFLKTSFLISLPLSISALSYLVYSFKLPWKTWYGWRGIRSTILVFVFSFLFFLTLLGVGLCLSDLSEMALSDKVRFSLNVGFFTLIAGGLLFGARSKWRVTYGLSEVFAGVLIASHRAYGEDGLWSKANSDFYLAVLAGGIYLVVRGLDNVSQGGHLKRDPAILLMNWIKDRVLITDPEEVKKSYGE